MEERRKQSRQRLMSETVVLDANTGELLGRIGNLTTEGLMLRSDQALDIDYTYALQIRLPDEVGGRAELNLEARSLWSQRAVDPTYFATGFEILNVDEEDRKVLEILIEDAVFQRWIS